MIPTTRRRNGRPSGPQPELALRIELEDRTARQETENGPPIHNQRRHEMATFYKLEATTTAVSSSGTITTRVS